MLHYNEKEKTVFQDSMVPNENKILRMNIIELETQLYNAYKRIAQLISEKEQQHCQQKSTL